MRNCYFHAVFKLISLSLFFHHLIMMCAVFFEFYGCLSSCISSIWAFFHHCNFKYFLFPIFSSPSETPSISLIPGPLRSIQISSLFFFLLQDLNCPYLQVCWLFLLRSQTCCWIPPVKFLFHSLCFSAPEFLFGSFLLFLFTFSPGCFYFFAHYFC